MPRGKEVNASAPCPNNRWKAGGLAFAVEVDFDSRRQMRHNIQILHLLTVLPLALCWPARVVSALDQANPADQTAPTPTSFQEFLQGLRPLAEEKGITRRTFDGAFAGLTLDPALPAASNRQAGFHQSLKFYLDEADS